MPNDGKHSPSLRPIGKQASTGKQAKDEASKPAPLGALIRKILSHPSGRKLLHLSRKGLGKASKGLGKASRFTQKEISPRARLAARKVRYHSSPEVLGKDYKAFLHTAQELGYDRGIERLFFIPAKGHIPLDELTIDSPNRAFGHDYHPVHRQSFNWAMTQITTELSDRLSDFTFVDYGAGRGRALLLASLYPLRKIIGVEFAKELQDDAMMNIAQFPRSLMKCRDVECHLMDAVNIDIPAGKSIFFINDSFGPEVLETVLARMVAAYRANPRRFYLILVHPPKPEQLTPLMERTVIFEPLDASQSEKMRMQMLSPDEVQIFRTLV